MAEAKESRDYYCEVIMDEANKMNKMVQQLLTLNALEFGSDGPSMERFDIVELIQGVLSSAQILIEQKEAQIIFEPSGPLYVWADEFKIEEVITNYISLSLIHICVRLGLSKHRSENGRFKWVSIKTWQETL